MGSGSQHTNHMKYTDSGISLRTAALITGLTLFVPTAPFAEFYVFKKLIVYNNAAQTTQNLLAHSRLFMLGIMAIFFTYLKDVLLAWTLYIFLRPVNPLLSLLAGWFRIVYTMLAMVALLNFLYAYLLVNSPALPVSGISEQVGQWVNARRWAMYLAYIIFGIYLVMIGTLMYKAPYIPKLLGILMIAAGISWMIISLRPFFFKSADLSWMMIFSVGELFFPIWLLVKGRWIKEGENISIHALR